MVSELVDPPTTMSEDDAIAECYIRMQGVLRELSNQLRQINARSTADFAEIKEILATKLPEVRQTMKLTGDPHKAKEMEIGTPKLNQLQEEERFRAAEGGDSLLFRALPPDQFARALALQNDNDRSLLHVVTSADRPETVSIFADVDQSNSMINIKGEVVWAPIHSASSIGNVQIMVILLNKGANVNLKNDEQWTALHYAASEGWSNVEEILTAHRAKIYLKVKEGITVLHRAANTRKSEECELDVFVEPMALSPHRSGHHKIPLKQGRIHPSNTLYSFPMALEKKKDRPGWLQPYRQRTLLMQNYSKPTSLYYGPFLMLSQFESARIEMLEFSDLIKNIVHCIELELAPGDVDATLQTILHVSRSAQLQDALPKAEVLWYLLPLWLQREISQAYEQQTNPLQCQKLAEVILKILAEGDDMEVKTKFLVHQQLDKLSFIKYLLRIRLKIVWCTRLARAEVEHKRKMTVKEMVGLNPELSIMVEQLHTNLEKCSKPTDVIVISPDSVEEAKVKKDEETKKTVDKDFENKNKKSEKSSRHNIPTLTSVLATRSKAACGLSRRPGGVADIDAADAGDELAVSEYIDDLYLFYKESENECRPRDYMLSQLEINEKMRAILVDWLIGVYHKFELMPETLYLAINIIDRFLPSEAVPRKELQLLGMSAMFMASKYEGIWAPEVNDFACIANRAYNNMQILAMEKTILGKLKWTLVVPTHYVFLARFINASLGEDKLKHMVQFLPELGLMNYGIVIWCSPSMVAASTVYAARCASSGVMEQGKMRRGNIMTYRIVFLIYLWTSYRITGDSEEHQSLEDKGLFMGGELIRVILKQLKMGLMLVSKYGP